MNVPEEIAERIGYDKYISQYGMALKMLLGGNLGNLCSYDTYQLKDYSKVFADRFNPKQKTKRREEVFPK